MFKVIFFWALLVLVASVFRSGIADGIEWYAAVVGWNWQSKLLLFLIVIGGLRLMWENFDRETRDPHVS